MSLKIICGPASSGKTQRAIDEFIAAVHRGDNPVFLAPSRPDALHFQRWILRALGNDGEPGVLTGGSCATVDAFYQGLFRQAMPESRVIEEGEKRLILRDVVDSLEGFHSVGVTARYPSFVRAIAGFIGEAELSGKEMGDVGAALRKWAAASKWRQGLTKDIFRIYDRYEAILRSEGLFDSETAQQRVLELLQDRKLVPETRTIVMDGFWDFTPFQFGLIGALAGLPLPLIVTLSLEHQHPAYSAPAHELERLAELPGARIEDLPAGMDSGSPTALRHLAENLFREDAPQVPADGCVVAMEAAGNRGQAELVAKEILELWRDGQDLNGIAVVTRGIGPQMSSIASVLEEYGVPFELTSPRPLAQTALGRAVMAALEFAAGIRPRQNLLAYLRSPFPCVDPAMVDDFDRDLRLKPFDGRDQLLAAWHGRKWRPRLRDLTALAAAGGEGRVALARKVLDMAAGLLTGVQYLSVSADQALPEDVASLKSLQAICDRVILWHGAGGDQAGGKTGSQDGFSILRTAINDATIRLPSQKNHNCVRLLDPHRILNQRFDIVFVCGLLEKQFPALGREDSLFSEPDRAQLRRHGLELESGEHRLDEEKFLFFRTLSRARRRVYLCHPYCDKEGKQTIPSLFLNDTLDLFEPPVGKIRKGIQEVAFPAASAPTMKQALSSLALEYEPGNTSAAKALVDRGKRAGLSSRLEASLLRASPDAPAISDPEVVRRLASQTSFSVTGLQTYLQCPYAYFIRHVLRPQDLAPVAHSLNRGTVVHDVLYEFNKRMKRSQVYLPWADRDQIAEARQQMKSIIGEAFVGSMGDVESVILETELVWHLDRFIDREARCRRDLRYYDFELNFGSPLRDAKRGKFGTRSTEQPLAMDGYDLSGRIDRVDWCGVDRPDGRDSDCAILIDYKTSKKPIRYKDFKARREIQIPLYMLALKRIFGLTPVGGEYYAIRGEQRGGLYLKGNEDLLGADSGQMNGNDFLDEDEFHAAVDEAISLADKAVAGIRAGQFPRKPIEEIDVCKWCFQGICRGAQEDGQQDDSDE